MTSSTLSILSIIIIFVNFVFTDDTSVGKCSKITGVQDLDTHEMLGNWYGIKQHNWNQQCHGDFIRSVIERNLSMTFRYRDASGKVVRRNFIAVQDSKDSANLRLYYENEDEQFWGTWELFYKDFPRCFAVAKCDDTTGHGDYDGRHHHKVTIILYCNTPQPSAEEIQPALDEIKRQGLSSFELEDIDHQNCTS